MIASDIKIGIRNILKNKVHSLISLLGLGVGLGCILLLSFLFIHENSFDRNIPNYNQLHRVIQGNDCRTSYPLGKAIKEDNQLVNNFFRYYSVSEFEIKDEHNEIINAENFACSDASIFDCLGINMKIGSPASSKSEVAISEKMAKKYFKDKNPTGQPLHVRLNDQFLDLIITGVYKNLPSNSTLDPNFIADIELTDEVFGNKKKMLGEYGYTYDDFKTNWDHCSFSTYLLLNTKANPDDVVNNMQKFINLQKDEKYKSMAYSLQPVADIYLKSNDITGNVFTRQGNANELKYYILIAALILFIAIINYIFLTRAKINGRLKEMGAKKALGASQISILKQILLESNFIAFLSLAPAIIIILFGIPFISHTLGRTMDAGIFTMWQTWLVFICITFFTGTLSGLFIGITVAKVSPVLLLNGKTKQIPRINSWSNSFLSLHFAIFIILIIGVLTLKKQINYALTNFKAIDIENVIICELNTAKLSQQFNVIKNEVDKLPGVIKTAGSSFIPPFNWFLPINLQSENQAVRFDGLIMGKGMIDLLGIQFLDGDDFDEFQEDKHDMIFNESAALQYNLKVGELFNESFLIKGIVKDFNGHSLRQLIQPMVIMQQNPEKMSLFAIKTNGVNDKAITENIQKLFQNISPDKIVNIYSLKDQISQFYQNEEQQTKLVSAFSLLAIILSVMGLFGMTLNTISQKTKEIGIRKVNGAKISEIMLMLNRNFIKWVAIAFVLGSPLAYFAMQKWLENFAYKTTISWWIFALAGCIALFIALLTVSWQSWKAARRNPIEALRYE
ncbi:MAG: FtsX-like permease family protein [Salinivirgaceae bacterium]|nr:FtsX-like permease family protein [Salinivirgaceae bacterium]